MNHRKNELLTFILDALRQHFPLKSRAMFGGHGLYHQGAIVGIIIDTTVYLKADTATAQFFIQNGSQPFAYERNGKVITMGYWHIPEDILEDQPKLEEWARHAITALQKK